MYVLTHIVSKALCIYVLTHIVIRALCIVLLTHIVGCSFGSPTHIVRDVTHIVSKALCIVSSDPHSK